MEKDPRRRYQSAKELGDDLERFVAGQPINARRIGVGERLARWAGRNPAVAGLTAAIFTVMAAGTLVSVMQAVRTGRAEDAALNAATAEKAAPSRWRGGRPRRGRRASRWRDGRPRRGRCSNSSRPGSLRPPVPAARAGAWATRCRSGRGAEVVAAPVSPGGFRGQPLVEARLRRTLGSSRSCDWANPGSLGSNFDAALRRAQRRIPTAPTTPTRWGP